MTGVGFACPECGEDVEPVWATHEGSTSVDGQLGSATFRLPLHRCPQGHLSGWRAGEDFLADLALEEVTTDYGHLNANTVESSVRLFSTRCGRWKNKLGLQSTGNRLCGVMRIEVERSEDLIEFDLDIPEIACRQCGARPDIMNTKANSPEDIGGWIFQLLAAGMPLGNATKIEARG